MQHEGLTRQNAPAATVADKAQPISKDASAAAVSDKAQAALDAVAKGPTNKSNPDKDDDHEGFGATDTGPGAADRGTTGLTGNADASLKGSWLTQLIGTMSGLSVSYIFIARYTSFLLNLHAQTTSQRSFCNRCQVRFAAACTQGVVLSLTHIKFWG